MPRASRQSNEPPKNSRAAPTRKTRAARTPRSSGAAEQHSKERWWKANDDSRKVLFHFVIPVTVIIFSLTVGTRMAFAYVRQMPQFRVNAGQLVMDNRPAWLKQDAAQSIHMKAFRRNDVSIFDADLLPKIRTEYERDPWVLKVESISKSFPSSVHVSLVLRRPVARVNSQLGTYLVDLNGVVVDILNPSHDRNYHHLPLVSGMSTDPPLRGQSWADPAVRAGLGVAEVLLDEKLTEELSVEDINVSNYRGAVDPRESEVVINLPHGHRIHWGRGIDTYGELPVAVKLAKIRDCVEQTRGCLDLDWIVRYPKTVFRARESSLTDGGGER